MAHTSRIDIALHCIQGIAMSEENGRHGLCHSYTSRARERLGWVSSLELHSVAGSEQCRMAGRLNRWVGSSLPNSGIKRCGLT
jgi:hypothetical protein